MWISVSVFKILLTFVWILLVREKSDSSYNSSKDKAVWCLVWHLFTVCPWHPFLIPTILQKQGKQLSLLEGWLNHENPCRKRMKDAGFKPSHCTEIFWENINHAAFHFLFLSPREQFLWRLSENWSLGQEKKKAKWVWKLAVSPWVLVWAKLSRFCSR